MAISINGTSGISGVDGSAGTPALQGSDTNTGIAFGSDVIIGSTGGTERFRCDSSGRVGISTASPSALLHLGNPGAKIRIGEDAGSEYADIYRDTSTGFIIYNAAQASPYRGHVWQLGGTESARIDSSGNFAFNSGYGSSATAYGCRAWVNFNGTGVVAIRASGNVSSITDNGTGDYTVNFTTAMPDANYAAIGTTGPKGANSEALTVKSYVSAGSVRIETHAGGSAAGDCANNNLAIFR